MFKKVLLIGVLCVASMALLVPQATAGCCCNPRFCASWLAGSVESYHTAVVRNYPADCIPGTNCPLTAAAAYGVEPFGALPLPDDCIYSFNPESPNPNCAIPGLALCNNPADKKPRNFPSGTAQPYYFAGFVTTGFQNFDCTNNGNCKKLLTLPFTGVCKDNWNLADFTAEEFIGVQDMCPGGFDNSSPKKCCSTDARNSDGSCAVLNPGLINGGSAALPGKPNRYVKFCFKDLTNYQFGDSFTYCCAYCKRNENGTYDCDDARTLALNGQCIQ